MTDLPLIYKAIMGPPILVKAKAYHAPEMEKKSRLKMINYSYSSLPFEQTSSLPRDQGSTTT